MTTQESSSVPSVELLLEYSLIKTTRRLTFDIHYQAPKTIYTGDDDGDYFVFFASNDYQVISRSRMDIQTERIWLLGAKHAEETRSGSMIFSCDEKRDIAYDRFVAAINEWAGFNGGVATNRRTSPSPAEVSSELNLTDEIDRLANQHLRISEMTGQISGTREFGYALFRALNQRLAVKEGEAVECDNCHQPATYRAHWQHGADSNICQHCVNEFEQQAREIDAHEDRLAAAGNPFTSHCPRPTLEHIASQPAHPVSDDQQAKDAARLDALPEILRKHDLMMWGKPGRIEYSFMPKTPSTPAVVMEFFKSFRALIDAATKQEG